MRLFFAINSEPQFHIRKVWGQYRRLEVSIRMAWGSRRESVGTVQIVISRQLVGM